MKKYKTATIILKRVIWDGARKQPIGHKFIDEKYFDGKYSEDMADVVIHEAPVLEEEGEKEEMPSSPPAEPTDGLDQILSKQNK